MTSIYDLDFGVCEKHGLKICATPLSLGSTYFVGCNGCYFENLRHFKNDIGTPGCSADYRGEFSGTNDLELVTCPLCYEMTEIMRAVDKAKCATATIEHDAALVVRQGQRKDSAGA